MPGDQKRINGPENTVSYHLCSSVGLKAFLDEKKRTDGRAALEHRKIYLKAGVVSQAKGSAYMEVNNSKVIVSVFDPREIPNKTDYSLQGELYCEFKYAPFSCAKRRMHQQDAEEKEFSIILKRALEPAVCRHEFPNFQVDIYALVLQNDGSCLSAAITCAGLALAYAGVPMYDVVTAATLGVHRDAIFLDPTSDESVLCQTCPLESDEAEETCSDHGIMVLSMLSTQQQISELHQDGSVCLDTTRKGIEILTKASKEIVPLVQKCMVKHVATAERRKRRIEIV